MLVALNIEWVVNIEDAVSSAVSALCEVTSAALARLCGYDPEDVEDEEISESLYANSCLMDIGCVDMATLYQSMGLPTEVVLPQSMEDKSEEEVLEWLAEEYACPISDLTLVEESADSIHRHANVNDEDDWSEEWGPGLKSGRRKGRND